MSFRRKVQKTVKRFVGSGSVSVPDTEPIPSAVEREHTQGDQGGKDIRNVDMFRGAHDVLIHGGNQTVVGGDLFHIGTQVVHQYATSENTNTERELFIALNPVPAAHDCQEVTSKVSGCFQGTRQRLLEEIWTWSTSGSESVFILDGIAGIGKSTVAKSVSVQAAAEGRLAASFFFSRDHEKRRTTKWFVPTIAYQMSRYHPVLRDQISQALHQNPDVLQKDFRIQYITLVQKPLQMFLTAIQASPLVSIDALDECQPEEALLLLSILMSTSTSLPQLHIFLTCRPERGIRLLLQKSQGRRVYRFQDIEDSVVESDIRHYINHRLSPAGVTDALPDLHPPPWQPSRHDKDQLVLMAGKLFIIASTSINFILDPRRLAPEEQLQKILEANGGQSIHPMDAIYTQVLRAALPTPVETWLDDYREVVGSILVLADILPSEPLARLLAIPINKIIRTLAHLHSLISPTHDNEVFRVHHKSFPDFVMDAQRCSIDPRFYINPSACHTFVAERCFQVMNQNLKQNICQLPLEDWHKDIVELPPNVKDRISKELAYACTHWAFHLQRSELSSIDQGSAIVGLIRTFAFKHILSWLEVLAFIDRFDVAWTSLNAASSALGQYLHKFDPREISEACSVSDILEDGLRFISLSPVMARWCPMHIYLSSLPFVPSGTRLFQLYRHLLDKTVKVTSGIEEHWDPIVAVLRHRRDVFDLAFSPGGTLIATSSDCICLWDTRTGGLLREYSHRFNVRPRLSFSPDGAYLAAADDHGVRVWDATTGYIVSTLPLLSDLSVPNTPETPDPGIMARRSFVTSITFSIDGSFVAIGNRDGKIVVWRTEDEMDHQVLFSEGDPNCRCNCAPGPSSFHCLEHSIVQLSPISRSQLVVGSSKTKVDFWDINTAKRTTTTLRNGYCKLPFSSDGGRVAVDSNRNFTIGVYNVDTVKVSSLSGHQDFVTAMGFSADGRTLLSTSMDKSVRLWDVDLQSQLIYHRPGPIFRHVSYSTALSDFILEASEGASPNRLELWGGGICIPFGPTLPYHDSSDGWIALAGNGSTLAIQGHYLDFTALCDLYLARQSEPTTDVKSRFQPTSNANYRFLPTGDSVISISLAEDRLVVVYHNSPSKTIVISPWNQHENHSTYSSDYSRIAFAMNWGTILVYNLATGARQCILQMGPGEERDAYSYAAMAFSLDCTKLCAKRTHQLYMWGLPTNESDPLQPEPTIFPSIKCDIPEYEGFQRLKFSPEGQPVVATSGQVNELQLNRNCWTQIPIPVHSSMCNFTISMDASKLILAGASAETPATSFYVWTRPSYTLVATLSGHHHTRHTSLRILPQYPNILITRCSHALTIWDLRSYRKISEFVMNSMVFWYCYSYSPTDHIMFVQRRFPTTNWGIIFVQLVGTGPPNVRNLCWLPPRLDISRMSVNPQNPKLVVLSGGKTAYYLDLSNLSTHVQGLSFP